MKQKKLNLNKLIISKLNNPITIRGGAEECDYINTNSSGKPHDKTIFTEDSEPG